MYTHEDTLHGFPRAHLERPAYLTLAEQIALREALWEWRQAARARYCISGHDYSQLAIRHAHVVADPGAWS